MPIEPNARCPIMCLTQDGLPLGHAAQARALCAAGARWIQLRMKDATTDVWLATAREVVAVCREHGACCIVNDNVDIALASDADGVHLGKLDLDWRAARARLGPHRLLGGTVNNVADAARAVASGCLDYVGVGPLRFTTTKKNLAPVLGIEGIHELITTLGDLPAWVIGGVQPQDLPSVQATGAAGVAVSSSLYADGAVARHFQTYLAAWPQQTALP